MQLRLLWSLHKAAPSVMRLLGCYAELAAQDLAQMQRDLGARLVAIAILVFSAFLFVLSVCVLIVALTWDTPHRIGAIIGMGGAFLILAVAAALSHSKLRASQAPFLASVRREWQEDRVIVEQLLSPDERES
jgi:uncharacterized membrane protein YqjE